MFIETYRYQSTMNTKDFKEQVLSLSDRLFPMVARMLGNTENAEDAVQGIMIKLWDKRKIMDKHPNIPGFVFLTARNYCLDILKRKRPELVDSTLQLNRLSSENTGLDELERAELHQLILQAIGKLPKKQQEVMLLRDIDGLDSAEICAIMDCKIEHIRVLLSRARKEVRKELRKIYSYEQGNY